MINSNEKPNNSNSCDELVDDYCCGGDVGKELMRKAIRKMRSTKQDIVRPDGTKDSVEVNSLWAIQMFVDFPWTDSICSQVRAQGKSDSYMFDKDELVSAVDVVSVLMAAQDVVLEFIASDVLSVVKRPPLWVEGWKEAIEKVIIATKLVVSARQAECAHLAAFYIEERDVAAKYISKKGRHSVHVKERMRMLTQTTLEGYIRSWEFAFGKLLDVIRSVSGTIFKLGGEPQKPVDEKVRTRDLAHIANFNQLDTHELCKPYNESRFYRRFVEDPQRYIFTFGLQVAQCETLTPMEQKFMRERARQFDEFADKMRKVPNVDKICERRLSGDIFVFLQGVIDDMKRTDYAPLEDAMRQAALEEEEEAGEEEEKKGESGDNSPPVIPTPPSSPFANGGDDASSWGSVSIVEEEVEEVARRITRLDHATTGEEGPITTYDDEEDMGTEEM